MKRPSFTAARPWVCRAVRTFAGLRNLNSTPGGGRSFTIVRMSLMDRIVIDPAVVHGRPAVRGTRMRVTDVLSLLAAGASENEILEDYPYLSIEDIRACLAYAAVQADHVVLSAS